MRVAVIGNSPANTGVALAADLALAGHDVALAEWRPGEIDFPAIAAAGGLRLAGEASHLLSGLNGRAKLSLSLSPRDAMLNAELVMLDCPPADVEACGRAIAGHLADGQVVHISQATYFSALRLWPILAEAGARGVVLTEITAPIASATYAGDAVTVTWRRNGLKVAAFPSNNADRAMDRMQAIYTGLRRASNVLETSFSTLNLLVHPSVALLNIARMDRLGERGELDSFWREGPSESTERLAAAQDGERKRVFEAYGLSWTSVAEDLSLAYGMHESSLRRTQETCPYYLSLPARPAAIWKRWLGIDVPMALTPFVAFARLAGVEVPIHQGFLALFDVFLEQDAKFPRHDLKNFALSYASKSDVHTYVEKGRL